MTRVEYAVRYTAPEPFAGVVAHIRDSQDVAEAMARHERSHPDFACHVVRRVVTLGEWEPVGAAS